MEKDKERQEFGIGDIVLATLKESGAVTTGEITSHYKDTRKGNDRYVVRFPESTFDEPVLRMDTFCEEELKLVAKAKRDDDDKDPHTDEGICNGSWKTVPDQTVTDKDGNVIFSKYGSIRICNPMDNPQNDKELQPQRQESGSSDSYEEIVSAMCEVRRKKASDYGDTAHNMFLKYGADYFTMMVDQKMERVRNLARNGKLPDNESIEDSFTDAANYCIMAIMELRRKNK